MPGILKVANASFKYRVANMSFNAIRENKILAKISEFTVSLHLQLWARKHMPDIRYNNFNSCVVVFAPFA